MKYLYNEITMVVEYDFDDWVLVDVPDSVDHEDEEAVEEDIEMSRPKMENQGIVGDLDVVESLRLILDAEGLPANQVLHILESLNDAMTNNYGA